MKEHKGLWSNIMIPVVLFIILELVLVKIGLHEILNWAYYRFNLTQFEANFLLKIGELLIVILLNQWITKQKLFFARHLNCKDFVFWLTLMVIAIPFFETDNLTMSLGTGIMGGFSEEFLARGVILGMLITWMYRKNPRMKSIVMVVIYSNLIFALMHLTNLTHMSFSYVILQSVLAFFAGLAYSAIYVQTGSLWYPIALHFLEDFTLTAMESLSSSDGHLAALGLSIFSQLKILIVLYSLWYWRKKQPALVRKISK